jgi:hypothetical protein
MTGLPLLDYRPPAITPAGERGMSRAAAHADRQSDGWTDRAFAALTAAARSMPGAFTIEEVRARIQIDAPPDGRAWGAVVVRATRAGVIRRTGGCAPAASSNGAVKPLWEVVR